MKPPRKPAPPSHQLPDAGRDNWVDQFAPVALRPWLKLGRFDRPIGIWLLYLPGAMGLFFGWSGRLAEFPILNLILFALGAALMRSAGCAYNDFVDRDIDAAVARTRGRPIPSGQISPKQALAYVGITSLLSFLILLQLGRLAIILGFASLVLVAAYPFMKRITWWPQAWLGLTFNWGFLMGFASLSHTLTTASVIFYLGLVFWTLGYDTIYALQDIEDDAMIGVKSSARALKTHVREGVAVFYGLAVGLTLMAGVLSQLSLVFYVAMLGVASHLGRQVMYLYPIEGGRALRLFKSNRTTGLLWVAALVAAQIFHP